MKFLSKYIPHNQISISKKEKNAVADVISSGWIAQGKQVECFENEIAEFLMLEPGTVLVYGSCSQALFSLLNEFPTNINLVGIPVYVSRILKGAIITANKKCDFIDIEPNSPNIDMSALINSKSKLSIIPHMFGIPANIDSLKNSKLDFIENISHAIGGKIDNNFLGTFGKASVVSFQATKVITTGGMGGAVISKDKSLISELKFKRDFDDKSIIGNSLNFKMTDISAAFGRSQLSRINYFLMKREEIFQTYKHFGLPLLESLHKNANSVKYRAIVKTNNQQKLIEELEKRNIKAIVPIENWELLDKRKKFINAHRLTKNLVSLPIYPNLKISDAKAISKIVINNL